MTHKALQAGEYIVAVLPSTTQGEQGAIQYSEVFLIEDLKKEKPIEKEYLVKLYDSKLNFVKVCPLSIITNDISFSESINAGQGELTLNLNLPIDTNYFESVKYIKVFVNDSQGLEDHLIYSGYLSKYVRIYSNNRENIQAHFLSLFSLFNEIYYKQGEEVRSCGNYQRDCGSGFSCLSWNLQLHCRKHRELRTICRARDQRQEMRRFDLRNCEWHKLSVLCLSGWDYSLQTETKRDFTLFYL